MDHNFPSHRPSSEGVTSRNFTVEVMDSKGRVLFVPDSVDCVLEVNVPDRESFPVLLWHIVDVAELVPLPLIGLGKEIHFLRRELCVGGRVHF